MPPNEHLRISAKNLGALALPDACHRCFWLKLKTGNKLPFQIFPGIFSTLDSFQKHVTHGYFATHGRFPDWFRAFGEFADIMDIPHHTKFRMYDRETNITLTGVPDEMLRRANGAIAILDYKTARFTKNQDALLPMYRVQLNGYTLITEHLGFGTIDKLGLIYFEPITELDHTAFATKANTDGFLMHFNAKPLPIDIDRAMIVPLLQQARELFDLGEPPAGRDGCTDCERVEEMLELLREGNPACV